MSKCVVHMQKMKMTALCGIQSHNQREHESRKNKDIDYEKSGENIDLLHEQPIKYYKAVKSRIEDLHLKKAVRKDAVVYCSFIVSSDTRYFQRLGEEVLARRGNPNGLNLKDYEVAMPTEYARILKEGSKEFFREATQFFQERYGKENVINATLHFDETTPHMHIGIVPVTTDGRLSAKEIFTPLELKQLQTDFAERIGRKFDLERGLEGSDTKHLDELSYKLKMENEKLQRVREEVSKIQRSEYTLQQNCESLQKQARSLSKQVSDLKGYITTLDTQKRLYERIIEEFKQAITKILALAKQKGISREQLQNEVMKNQALNYIKHIGHAEQFKQYIKTPDHNIKRHQSKDELERS